MSLVYDIRAIRSTKDLKDTLKISTEHSIFPTVLAYNEMIMVLAVASQKENVTDRWMPKEKS